MKKRIVPGFAAMGVAAAIIVPLSFGAQGRETRAERSASTISQSTDRAEARIAILKADLRLSPDQAQHWAGLESALHDIVSALPTSWRSVPRAGRRPTTCKRGEPQAMLPWHRTFRSRKTSKDGTPTQSATRARRGWMTSMRCAARPTPIPCRPRSCARSPTQRSRSTTHSMTANATGSCNSFAKI